VATLTLATQSYTPKKWNLSGLKGISDKTIETHFGLYEGYVKNTNLLNEKLAAKIEAGQASGADPEFAELNRRAGWEYNGMRLHELYFDNLTASSGDPGSTIKTALAAAYGDFDTWKKDFMAVGGMRGVGWAIAYQDPTNGRITNHWIEQHQNGNIAGFAPIVVMDVWEHAFLLDYKPSERAKYIEAFFSNLDWSAISERLVHAGGNGKAASTTR